MKPYLLGSGLQADRGCSMDFSAGRGEPRPYAHFSPVDLAAHGHCTHAFEVIWK